MVIYADLVGLLNFCVDFLLLQGTNQLTGYPASPGRCALAALIGAVYSGACLVPEVQFLGGTLWRAVFLGLMGAAAFGRPDRRLGVFVLLNFSLGGLVLLLHSDAVFAPAAAAVILWLACRWLLGRAGGRKLQNVQIQGPLGCITLTALQDTGNTLTDPLTGQSVLIVDAAAAQVLSGLTQAELKMPAQTLMNHPDKKLRLVSFRAVGNDSGLLLAGRYDVKIGSNRGRQLVAFAPEGLGSGEYRALMGGN